MPTEAPPPKKEPSGLEKTTLGKGGVQQAELKPKGGAKAQLTDDVMYPQSSQSLEDLHNFNVDFKFAGPVYPKKENHGQNINLSTGNPKWLDTKDPGQSKGLTSAQRNQMLDIYGRNELTPPKQDPEIVKFGKQFLGFFSLLLIAGGVLCFVAYGADPAGKENVCYTQHKQNRAEQKGEEENTTNGVLFFFTR